MQDSNYFDGEILLLTYDGDDQILIVDPSDEIIAAWGRGFEPDLTPLVDFDWSVFRKPSADAGPSLGR